MSSNLNSNLLHYECVETVINYEIIVTNIAENLWIRNNLENHTEKCLQLFSLLSFPLINLL